MFSQYSNNLSRYNNSILIKAFAFLLLLSVALNFLLLEGDLRFRILFFSVKNKTHRKIVNITCHYIDISDALSPIEENSSIPLKSIFFHETSCRGRLNSRQACSVESAARAHPHWQINVLFSGPVTNENLNIHGSLNALKQFTNVKFFRLHLLQYVKGTPVENLVSGGALNRSWWPIQHTSDVLRLLTLSKWGGVYLDLDQLVVKSFEDLGNNWVVRETKKTLASSPLSIGKDPLGKAVVDAALSNFNTYYRETKWSHGSMLITAVLQKMCNMTDVNLMSARSCRGFKVLSKELFFPVNLARRYFDSKVIRVGSHTYAHHMYNQLTAKFKVTIESVYAGMAQKFCPTIHELYGDQFGD